MYIKNGRKNVLGVRVSRDPAALVKRVIYRFPLPRDLLFATANYFHIVTRGWDDNVNWSER